MSTKNRWTPVFPLTLWLISDCPNFLETIVLKALDRRSSTLNFVPIIFKVYKMSCYLKFLEFSKAKFTILPKSICLCSDKSLIR